MPVATCHRFATLGSMEMHLHKFWAAKTPAEFLPQYWALVREGFSGETAHCRLMDPTSWARRSTNTKAA